MSKQDRQGVRNPAGLEQKYNFGRISEQEKKLAKQDVELSRQNMTTSEFISYATFAIDKLTKDLTDANALIADLQDADTAFDKRVSAAEGSIKDHEESISDHGTRLSSAEGSISDQNTRLTAAEGSISDQGTRLTAAESDIDLLEARVSTLETGSTT